jgi:peptidylprolyl isomerase
LPWGDCASGQEKTTDLFSGDFTTTPSGLQYRILNAGDEKRAGEGYRISIDLKGSTEEGVLFVNTPATGKPLSLIAGTGQMVAGLDEGIRLIGEGGEILLKVPAALGYGDRGTRGVPPGSNLRFHVRLLEISDHPVSVVPYPAAGKDTLTTPSGLKYIILKEGDGPSPHKRDHVTVHYTGYLPGGKVFDSSVLKGKPFTFRLGDPQIIKGWNEGIALMRQGGKGRLLVPWKMAYGKKGLPPVIPQKTDLIFDVELLEITR